jgi:histidinol-phosphate aminotransferase
VSALPAYRAGRGPTRPAARTFKCSSNENPYPPLPGVLDAVAEAAEQLHRYPDPACTRLTHALATRLDVAPERLALGTGSVAVLQQVVQAVAEPGDEVVYAWRSFEAYPIVTGIAGATTVPVPLTASAEHDLDAMLAAVTPRTRLVLVCTPNNPTGPTVRHDDLERFCDALPDDVLVAVDEAYAELVRDPAAADGLRLARERDAVVALRTFSKAYGLAGLRVGYAVAHPEVATALRAVAVPFGVSGVAQAAAVASLAAEAALLQRVDALVAERERVQRTLREQGWRLPVSQANFVWFGLPDAEAFGAACERARVAVRVFPGEGVRVTVAEPEANDLVLEVSARWMARARHAEDWSPTLRPL